MDGQMTIRQFADVIAERLPAMFDGLNMVHGNISVKDIAISNSATTPYIVISVPGVDDAEMGYNCVGAYASYRKWEENRLDDENADDENADDENADDENADDENAREENNAISTYAESLIDAYNKDLIGYLRNKPAYDAFLDNLSDARYTASHSYPVLTYADDADNADDALVTVPSGIDGLVIMFDLIDDFRRISTTLYEHMLPGELLRDLGRFKENCLVNLNTNILKWLHTENISTWSEDYPFGNGISSPLDIDMTLAMTLYDMFRRASSNNKVYAASLAGSDVFPGTATMLLSRTGMLAIAKAIGAQRSFIALPLGYCTMMIASSDPGPDFDIDAAKEAEREIQAYVSENPDIAMTTPMRLFEYDVLTGVLS